MLLVDIIDMGDNNYVNSRVAIHYAVGMIVGTNWFVKTYSHDSILSQLVDLWCLMPNMIWKNMCVLELTWKHLQWPVSKKH